MNKKLLKYALGIFVSLSFMSVATVADAYPYHCHWVHSYYHHGVYHPARKVCSGNYHHNRHNCYWHHGYQVCN